MKSVVAVNIVLPKVRPLAKEVKMVRLEKGGVTGLWIDLAYTEVSKNQRQVNTTKLARKVLSYTLETQKLKNWEIRSDSIPK